jgi:acetyl-CoA carboxylase biotin carboxyl carrier protein
MDREEIEALAKLLNEHQLTKLHLKEKNVELLLERGYAPAPMVPPVSFVSSPPAPTEPAPSPKQEAIGAFVTSPMVGTLYLAPSPDQPPFVKVGERVSKETVVCIVEAMKVMNEVKAGIEGTVAEVLVQSGHPIEFGSKLFRIT